MRQFMPRLAVLTAIACMPLPTQGEPAGSPAWRRFFMQSQALVADLNRTTAELPALPPGVTELKFSEFFGPIGDRGPEYSEKLRGLAACRIRIVGFMAREPVHAPGVFLLAPWPVTVESNGFCYHENLPPSTLHVLMPGTVGGPVPYRPGRLALIGTLELGPRVEADGRNSSVRLRLEVDGVAAFSAAAPAGPPAAGSPNFP